MRKGGRGYKNIKLNVFLLLATIAGLSYYFTAQAQWNAGTVAVIAILAMIAGFYIWLWKKF